jgi:hypothetical protein
MKRRCSQIGEEPCLGKVVGPVGVLRGPELHEELPLVLQVGGQVQLVVLLLLAEPVQDLNQDGNRIKGTVRPDWICMRMVSLERPLKGHQPLYVFNFLVLILNI